MRVSSGGQRLFMANVFKNEGHDQNSNDVSKLRGILLRQPAAITPKSKPTTKPRLSAPKVQIDIQPTNVTPKSSPSKLNIGTSPFVFRRSPKDELPVARARRKARNVNIAGVAIFLSVVTFLTLVFTPIQ